MLLNSPVHPEPLVAPKRHSEMRAEQAEAKASTAAD